MMACGRVCVFVWVNSGRERPDFVPFEIELLDFFSGLLTCSAFKLHLHLTFSLTYDIRVRVLSQLSLSLSYSKALSKPSKIAP